MNLIVFFLLISIFIPSISVFAQSPDSSSNASSIVNITKSTPAGFDTISGPLPKILLKKELPYYVKADIEVPADKTVTIEPGVVLLFKDFTGLHVQGRLVALGTHKEPIVFTSEFDTLYTKGNDITPNPFDWNGIYIHSGGIGSSIENCNILYSVYGIKSDCKYIRINETVFRDNGKSDLTIEGKQFDTGNDRFSYALDMKDALTDGVPVNILRDPLAPRRNVARYSGLAAAGSGLGIGVYYAQKAWSSQKELSRLSSDADEITGKYSNNDWQQSHDLRNKYLLYSISGGIAGLLGSLCFVWTFTF